MFQYVKKSYTLLGPNFRKKIGLIVLSYLLVSVLEALGIMLIFPVTALIINPDSITTLSLYKKLALYFPNHFLDRLTLILPPMMVMAFILKNVAAILVSRWQIRLINNQSKRMAIDLFDRYATMDYLKSLNRDTSFLNYTILSAGSIFYSSYVTPLFQFLADILTILVLLLMMISLNIKTAIVAFGIAALLGGILYSFTKTKLKQAGHDNRVYSEKLVRVIKESFLNFKEFKVLDRVAYFKERFLHSREKTNEFQSKQMIYVMINRYAIELLIIVLTTLVAYLVLISHSKALALAELSLYAMLAVRLMPTLIRIATSLQTMKTAESSIDLLEEEASAFASSNSVSLLKNETVIKNPRLLFRDMNFNYPLAKTPTLIDINCEIKPNTAVGIVGRTGSGKTTLVDIILGLLPVESGSFTVNGEPVERLAAWRKCLGYVPQEISFLDATLSENIAYGIPKEEIDFNRIQEVVLLAELQEDIAKLDNGLDTVLQEGAHNLSGGQRQRVGIARALYKMPSVLVMDEATSALDVETESKISAAIHRIKEQCTVIVIAHRLSTIKDCDTILYLDQGRIIAEGSFEALCNTNAKFLHLVHLSDISRRNTLQEHDYASV